MPTASRAGPRSYLVYVDASFSVTPLELPDADGLSQIQVTSEGDLWGLTKGGGLVRKRR